MRYSGLRHLNRMGVAGYTRNRSNMQRGIIELKFETIKACQWRRQQRHENANALIINKRKGEEGTKQLKSTLP